MVGFYERLTSQLIGEIYSYQEEDRTILFYKITKITFDPKFGLMQVTADLLDLEFQPKTKDLPLPHQILEELVLLEK